MGIASRPRRECSHQSGVCAASTHTRSCPSFLQPSASLAAHSQSLQRRLMTPWRSARAAAGWRTTERQSRCGFSGSPGRAASAAMACNLCAEHSTAGKAEGSSRRVCEGANLMAVCRPFTRRTCHWPLSPFPPCLTGAAAAGGQHPAIHFRPDSRQERRRVAAAEMFGVV